ncbi:MAG: sulfur carrier protein ThiS [Alicyclobacillus sp.]|nr:sulfur carrier protein ThiS [Alicyclobacillus sp.]
MRVTVNGQPREIPDGLTVQGMLEWFELGEERVAVECNGAILDRSGFATHVLQPGDVLEVVRFVGGG